MSTAMTLEQIRNAGVEALLRELGPVGMIRFLQQYETGRGDYTLDRHSWLDGDSVDSVSAQIREWRQNR